MNAQPWGHPGTAYPGMESQTIASDDAHVDQQVGVNFGETAYHRHETTYHINQDDPPERKHEVAINHLEGGTPRFAEELLRDLMRAGHATSERTYYYALAVLSDRSINEIDKEVFDAFDNALTTAARFDADQWRNALDVIEQFVFGASRQDIHPALDPDGLIKFDALPHPRQAEITRHLGMLLDGAIQDHLEAIDAQQVSTQRKEPDREGRAWKFFQPEPAKPRRLLTPPTPIGTATWIRAFAGGIAVLMGLLSLLQGIDQAGVLLSIPLLLVGGYLAIRHGLNRELLATRLKFKEFQHNHPPVPPVSPGHWVSGSFVQEIHQRVDACFREARPHVAGNWETDTRGIRESLKVRFVQLYGNAQVTPEAITWLIRWHAKQIGARWRSTTLFGYRFTLRPSVRAATLFGFGIALSAIGLVVLLSAGMIGTAVFLGVGGYFAANGAIAILAARRADAETQDENDRLFEQENDAFNEWVQKLKNRPSDAQMARWLDLDKAHLKTLALKRYGLTNREIVAYVVMTEGAPNAMRARVPHGPPRYSAYVVRLFLLTKSGVREVKVDLNFLTGAVHDEQRTSFGYDKLASVRVSEVGVRITNDRHYIIQHADQIEPPEIARLRSREFRLTLLSGEDITVIAENFKGLADTSVESESDLLRIALDTSGITGALHILEAVAAEGRDWITREQERRRRRYQEWRDSNTGQAFNAADFREFFTNSETGPESRTSPQ